MIQVVVGIVRNAQGHILIAQRPAHKCAPGLWEFPGGKIEKNENAFSALQREFKEEIGIDIHTARSWFQLTHDYSDRIVLLDTWLIDAFEGTPHGAEGQIIRWVSVQELDDYCFPAGNKEIIEKLRSVSDLLTPNKNC